MDLTELTFNECMAVIRQADWPKTLHFIRDPAGPDLEPCIKEGWAKFGVFGQNGAHRKRYMELREGELSHTKPTPGGAIAAKPDGSLDLSLLSGAFCRIGG